MRKARTVAGLEKMEMWAVTAMFLMTPTPCPSGVSEGHIFPYWVLWSLRGSINLPVFSTGVEMRRKCEMYEAKLRRLRTWLTPIFEGPPILPEPKLPVAMDDLRATSRMVALMIFPILLILTISDQLPVAFHDPP